MKNDWADALAKFTQGQCDIVPEGWKSTKQLVSDGMTREQVSQLFRAGLIDKQDFTIMTTRGRYPVPHYKPKK